MYWGTSRWSAMEIMVHTQKTAVDTNSLFSALSSPLCSFWLCFGLQEAYSVARQFNLIPPVCEQAEYHYFQRDKVEVQLPELYHKIGEASTFLETLATRMSLIKDLICFTGFHSLSLSGVGAMTWSPLACGLITGKYSDGVPECSRAAMKVSLS